MRFRQLAMIVALESVFFQACSYRITNHPMFAAISEGSVAKVGDLIHCGTDVNKQVGTDTPLTYAICCERIEVVRTLLQHGADPNRLLFDNKTPLTVAINSDECPSIQKDTDEETRMKSIALLLNAGADPNLPHWERTPLTMAFEAHQMRIFEQLRKVGARFNVNNKYAPLIRAARNGNVAGINSMLKLGVGPDDMYYGPARCTALCEAIDAGQPEAVRVLLGAQAKWNIDAWGQRIATSKSDILKQFLDEGLSANAIPRESLLFIAAEHGNVDNVALLISHGAVLDFQDAHGVTPLMIAAQNGMIEIVKVLLTARADYSLLNDSAKTAKMIAADAHKEEIVQLLAAAGANEYIGSNMPLSSRYAEELNGKEQQDISRTFHKVLSFVPKNFRYFIAYTPLPKSNVEPDFRTTPGGIYAVSPSKEVMKISSPSSFANVNFKIASSTQALELVKFFSDPNSAVGWYDIVLSFDEIPFTDFPEGSRCLSIFPTPSTYGITSPKVTERWTGDQKMYEVIRFGLRRLDDGKASEPNGNEDQPPRVVRVIEKVNENGNYVSTITDVPTPGLTIRTNCLAG